MLAAFTFGMQSSPISWEKTVADQAHPRRHFQQQNHFTAFSDSVTSATKSLKTRGHFNKFQPQNRSSMNIVIPVLVFFFPNHFSFWQ